ncbi:MAG: hypothetical protein KTR31_00865 [Myxococcales bacterium]|nr:hypothetical protein [Myxococcales bacterium]
MMRVLTVLAFLAAGCSGDEETDKPTDTNATNTDTTETNEMTGDSFPEQEDFLEPVAVGFEFDGVLRKDGSLTGYTPGLTGEGLGIMLLTFADIDFFSGDRDGTTCFALALFEPQPLPIVDYFDLEDAGVAMHSAYEVALELNPLASDCGDFVDPKVWGADASKLITPFVGARVGYGFAPMTDYLRDAWTKESLKSVGDSMVATYVALNDKNGQWVGRDWTTGIMFEWDSKTDELVVDKSGKLLVGIDVTGTNGGDLLPEGYVRSFAYWYQDFPLLDLSNLTDGAPK